MTKELSKFSRQVLVSTGFGAGWSSWCAHREAAQYAAEYQPIIDFITKNGNPFQEEHVNEVLIEKFNLLVEECKKEIKSKFNVDFYTGGAEQLCVKTVNELYRVYELDGYESIETLESAEEMWFY